MAGIKNQVVLEELVSYLSDPRPFVGDGAIPPVDSSCMAPLDVVKHSLQKRWPGKPTRIILLDVLVVILWRYTSVKDRRG
jgi:hypothetical protein